MTIPTFEEIIGHNDQIAARAEHLTKLQALIGNVYPNKFERSNITGGEDTISNIHDFAPVTEIVQELKDNTPEGEKPNQELKESLNEKLKAFGNVRVAGRLAVPPRVMGKAAFVHLSDGKERLQIYVRKQDASVISNDTGEKVAGEDAAWEVFKLLDHGDFIGAEGYLFLTNTGELSIHVETIQFLAKALLPMPDKVHGIADPELQRRYRYADLIADSLKIEHDAMPTREVFERRARLISGMRNYLDAHGYIEVETPMLTPKATGAAATPFETHHNALDIKLYARIAPELYLKRLVVGGFEKVYEINRNFRNEGLSHKHNPEFTMLEFYCAYMDVNGMMDFAEKMMQESVQKATGGSLQVEFDGNRIDFSNFERLTMRQAIAIHCPYFFLRLKFREAGDTSLLEEGISVDRIYRFYKTVESEAGKMYQEYVKAREEEKSEYCLDFSTFKRCTLPMSFYEDIWEQAEAQTRAEILKAAGDYTDSFQTARQIEEMFEVFAEHELIQPTFIIDYPKSISPLSKASPENPNIAERFELFVKGMEIANGFSELNNPGEQLERFTDQMSERERGDEEAMVMDEDYIRALAYGMPPAAGIGIGIDRLVMLLTNRHSIRDVILFPHLRPERRDAETQGHGDAETTN